MLATRVFLEPFRLTGSFYSDYSITPSRRLVTVTHQYTTRAQPLPHFRYGRLHRPATCGNTPLRVWRWYVTDVQADD